MFTRIGAAAYKPDLANTILLCSEMGNPQLSFKSIHVAGTNGKGSCSHLLASVCQVAGYKTGLYTSPHLIDFKERIKINGNEIEEAWLIAFVEKWKPSIEKIQPSFFELTVAMAFCYFAEQEVDIAIIETGLGGLLDSTNVITPELSVITNISHDHGYLLGNTLQEIAIQKAGIIKLNRPVVIGELNVESASVFINTAQKMNSQLVFADQVYQIELLTMEIDRQKVLVQHKITLHSFKLNIGLVGKYQLKNIKTVLSAIDLMNQSGWHISLDSIKQGVEHVVKNTGLKGRFDTLHLQPRVIVDVAHNEAGLREVFEQIEHIHFEQLIIVTGFVKDKEVDKVMTLFPRNAYYFFTQADIPRALPYHELCEKAIQNQLIGEGHLHVADAIHKAMSMANKNDLILVTGSFFILADVYSFFKLKN